jgi:hypothetical protein
MAEDVLWDLNEVKTPLTIELRWPIFRSEVRDAEGRMILCRGLRFHLDQPTQVILQEVVRGDGVMLCQQFKAEWRPVP